MNRLWELSSREKNLWLELLVDVVVAAYYLPKAWPLLRAGDMAMSSTAMARLVGSTVVLAIVLGIVVSMIFRIGDDGGDGEERRDERDHLFEARGNKAGWISLHILLALVLGQIVIGALFPGAMERGLEVREPLVVAHFILIALLIAGVIRSGVLLFSYRRGY